MVLVLALWLMSAAAHAQTSSQGPVAPTTATPASSPVPLSRLYDRSTAIYLSLAAASASTTATLLVTSRSDFLDGIAAAHFFLGIGYTIDAGLRIYGGYRARRAERAGAVYRPAGAQWICWMNLGLNGALTAGSAAGASLTDDHFAQGFLTSLAVHGAWLFAWSIMRVVHMRRDEPPWMVLGPTSVRF